MRKINLFLFLAPVLLSGCAKFDLIIRDLGSITPPTALFSMDTPVTNQIFFESNQVVITGVCDPTGSLVELTGDLFPIPASTACSVDGEYSYSTPLTPALITSRDPFNIIAAQTDYDGNPMDDSAINLKIHCTTDTTSELDTCTLGGAGNFTSDPYLVPNVACLQEMRDGLNCHYALTNDINANSTTSWNGGLGFEPVPLNPLNQAAVKFSGSLDGRGHKISNLVVKQRNVSGTGMFSAIFGEARNNNKTFVKNLTLENNQVEGDDTVGSITGKLYNANIENLSIINSSIVGSHPVAVNKIGGVVGYMTNSVLMDSNISHLNMTLSSTGAGNYTSINNIGGLVGESNNSDILRGSISNLEITNGPTMGSDSIYYTNVGGLTGFSNETYLNGFHADIKLNLSSRPFTVTDHSVSGIFKVGGVLGASQESGVNNICSNVDVDLSSNLSIKYVGGFIGHASGLQFLTGTNNGRLRVAVSEVNKEINNVGGFGGFSTQRSIVRDYFSGIDTYLDGHIITDSAGFIGHLFEGHPSAFSLERILRYGLFTLERPPLNPWAVGGFIGRHHETNLPLPKSNYIFFNQTGNPGNFEVIASVPSTDLTYQSLNQPEFASLTNAEYGFSFGPSSSWERSSQATIPYISFCR